MTRRVPARRKGREPCPAVTNAENSYDYAGQDPINGYDLSGLLYRNDTGEDDRPVGTVYQREVQGCGNGVYEICEQLQSDYGIGGSAGDITAAIKTAANVAIRVGKTYGVSCAINGAIGGLATGGTGAIVGCGEGIVEVWAGNHLPEPAAAGVTVTTVFLGNRRIFVESKFGKAYAGALGQALCAAFYPVCK
jgi:hypothetical protein